MEKKTYSIEIAAPRETVWNNLVDDQAFREWTEVFAKGSHFVGDWNEGSDIRFLAPNDDGSVSGMISTVAENRQPEFLSLKHVGQIASGVDDFDSEDVKKWAPALENYTLNQKGNGTELVVDVDTADEYAAMMDDTFPKALAKLKEISEIS